MPMISSPARHQFSISEMIMGAVQAATQLPPAGSQTVGLSFGGASAVSGGIVTKSGGGGAGGSQAGFGSTGSALGTGVGIGFGVGRDVGPVGNTVWGSGGGVLSTPDSGRVGTAAGGARWDRPTALSGSGPMAAGWIGAQHGVSGTGTAAASADVEMGADDVHLFS